MKKHYLNLWFLVSVLSLLAMGVLLLSSVSAVFSQQKFGKTTYYLFHQIIFGIVPGIVVGFILYKIDLSFIKKYSWILLLLSIGLMLFVFLPKIGLHSGGASRWINLGLATFQPSELLKLSFLIYLATLLANKKEKKAFIPFFFAVVFIVFLLFLQSNLSTLMVILVVSFFVYLSADTPLVHSIFLFFAGLAVSFFFIISSPYRTGRILTLLKPLKDPMGAGYQLKQSLIAVGSGGVLGLGLGMSSQKFGYLPQTMSDSIFAVFAEEGGFVGCFFLIAIFILFLLIVFKIALSSKDMFSRLFAIGFVSWVCFQGFVNIGAMIGIIPLTGIPLPFISYGGSHIIAELAGAGILLNISSKK